MSHTRVRSRRCYDRVVMSEDVEPVAMAMDSKIDATLAKHQEDMRRHLDIMLQKVDDAVRLVVEANARLDKTRRSNER